MAACDMCNVSCNDANLSIKCAGVCGMVYHLGCVNEKCPDSVKTRGSKKEWFCDSCKKSKPPSSASSKTGESSTQLFKQFFVNLLDAFKSEVFAELRNYSTQFAEFKNTLDFISTKFDEANKAMDIIREQNKTILKENEELKRSNADLILKIGTLDSKVRDLEQYSRRENIEVNGIPKTPGENEKEILRDLGRAIGIELDTNCVVAVHRVPAFNKTRTPALIARFTTRELRDTWIQKFKAGKTTLLASDISKNFPPSRVYIGEHLTPDNKVLLRNLKEEGQQLGVKFVWCREGRFYARKSEGYDSVRVNGVEDLRKVSWESVKRK